MVDVLMLASLGDKVLSDFLVLSKEFDVIKKERTQSFFSDRTIYDATAFTQTNGNGDEVAYLGHVIVGPNGRLGVDPSVVLGGDVDGASIHDVLAAEIAAHHDAETILASLLAGDDVIVGLPFGPSFTGSDINGYDGDDVLLVTGESKFDYSRPYLHGGTGDDLLFSANNQALYGEAGIDRFVIDSRGSQYWYVADLERGVERILLDRNMYPEVGNRITKEEIVYGSVAKDSTDRIIVEDYNNPGYWMISIDPDGVDGHARQFVGYIKMDERPAAKDFGTVDAAKLMPDVSKLFGNSAAPLDAFGPHHAAPQAAIPHDPTLPHGLIQLV